MLTLSLLLVTTSLTHLWTSLANDRAAVLTTCWCFSVGTAETLIYLFLWPNDAPIFSNYFHPRTQMRGSCLQKNKLPVVVFWLSWISQSKASINATFIQLNVRLYRKCVLYTHSQPQLTAADEKCLDQRALKVENLR